MPQLYLAGFVPGLLLSLVFMVTIAVCCVLRPAWSGVSPEASWAQRLSSLKGLLPPVAIFIIVIGSIYAVCDANRIRGP